MILPPVGVSHRSSFEERAKSCRNLVGFNYRQLPNPPAFGIPTGKRACDMKVHVRNSLVSRYAIVLPHCNPRSLVSGIYHSRSLSDSLH